MLTDYHLFYMKIDATRDELLDEWGRELTCEQDVWRMFTCYIGGEKNCIGKAVRHFPWNDEELSLETTLIQKSLVESNRRGILTINSQPAVNGKSSSDSVCGWGVPNGYVYQKVMSFVLFFIVENTTKIFRLIWNSLQVQTIFQHYELF
jgi:methylenetetrahydrofolate reductase (NADPH)